MSEPAKPSPDRTYISVGGEHYQVIGAGSAEDVIAALDDAIRQGSNLHLTVSLDVPGGPKNPILILNGAQLEWVAVWNEASPAGHPGMG